MGTWSQPNTTDKAVLLARLMQQPIPQTKASQLLYELVGDDGLYAEFDGIDADGDVRKCIQTHLKTALDNLEQSRFIWENDAITICHSIAHKRL